MLTIRHPLLAYEQAVTGPDAEHWKKAIQEELLSLKKYAVWKAVVLSAVAPGARAIPTKWVFKIKTDGNGRVAPFKARLVVCGYRQRFGRDYDQTFAPVAHAASIRTILALAIALGYHLHQFDVKTTFLYGVLPDNQRVYISPPKGVQVPAGHILSLLKAMYMYGLKQAPLQWNRHLNATLSRIGFKRSTFDPCVYFRTTSTGTLFLAVVVDDIITAASSPHATKEFEAQIHEASVRTDYSGESNTPGGP